MYELNILDLTQNRTFKKYFNSEFLMNKFINKCKYSKKIKIISNFKLN